LKKRQATNTKESYIKCHGDKGIELWHDRNKKWSIKMEEKYKNFEFCRIVNNNYTVSKIECRLFKQLESLINYKSQQQYRLKKYDVGYYVYDIIVYPNIIIEFNGDYWHANPKLYNENFINPFNKLTAKEIWNNHNIKLEHANKMGYITYVIWENDYINDNENTINKLINFINDNIKL